MSRDYVIKNKIEETSITSQEMRKHCQRPGKTNSKGEIKYFTEQAHKNETNINLIIKKYDKTGLINHISKFEASYGEHTGLDYKEAQDLIMGAQKSFDSLPIEIKKRFEQSPEQLLIFMEDGKNRAEAIELGLIDPTWTEATDGLGEHIAEGENVVKTKENIPASPQTASEAR